MCLYQNVSLKIKRNYRLMNVTFSGYLRTQVDFLSQPDELSFCATERYPLQEHISSPLVRDALPGNLL